MTRCRSMVWRRGEEGLGDGCLVTLDRISETMAEEDSLLWFDLVKPTPEDLEALAEGLGMAPTAVEDAIAPYERPKASQHEHHSFFVTYATSTGPHRPLAPGDPAATSAAGESAEAPAASPTTAGGSPGSSTSSAVGLEGEGHEGEGHAGEGDRAGVLHLTRVSGFVFPGGLVTVRSDDRFDVDEAVERWRSSPELLRLGSAALVHGLLDVIVDGYFTTVQDLDDRIEALEDDLFTIASRTTDFQRRAYRLRKELVALRRVVLPMREVVGNLWRHRPDEKRALDPYYADLNDHVLRAAEWTESLRDMIGTVFETHLSLQDQRLNVVMKKLTGWAAVISIPTLVTGWFGQNVPYLGFGTRTGYALAAVLTVVPAAVVWWLMRRNDWI